MRRLILPILCLILLGSAGCAGGTNADPGTNGPGKTDPGKTIRKPHRRTRPSLAVVRRARVTRFRRAR